MYKSGTYYNEANKSVEFKNRKTGKYEHYIGEESIINMTWTSKKYGYTKYRRISVIRDTKTKKILAWHKDLMEDRHYGNIL
jgi:hypothetical protein